MMRKNDLNAFIPVEKRIGAELPMYVVVWTTYFAIFHHLKMTYLGKNFDLKPRTLLLRI